MNHIFPAIELNDEELRIVAKHLGDTTVRKYLTALAYKTGNQIVLSTPAKGEHAEEFLRRQGRAQGMLDVLNTLLDDSFLNIDGA